MNNDFSLQFQAVGFVLSIILAVIFAANVKGKIKKKEEFSGMTWGFLNGIVGVGILWVVIAHSSINKVISEVKDKKYKKYAEEQMKDFVHTYAICLLVWIIIAVFISMV
ncbi:hypothetical protein IKF92_01465 [Candidatus Saccharibacteria bacterium]|nr:hypothetical protein [Candidatus Saccharibacteria bacterium]